jgi:hypothetical protein
MTQEVSGFGKRVVKVVDKSSEMDSISHKPINPVAMEHPTHKLHPCEQQELAAAVKYLQRLADF